MVWLAVKTPAVAPPQEQSKITTGADGDVPVMPPVVPVWAFVAVPSIFGGFLLLSSFLTRKARIAPPAPAPNRAAENIAALRQFQQREDNITRRGAALEQTEKQITERIQLDHFTDTIRQFKERARRIRRAWPDAEFNKRPMFLHSWIPSLDSPAPPWLRLATEWREGMIKVTYVSMHSDERLNAMDFDEVIELLDDADANNRGQKPFKQINTAGLPDVEITRWGPRDDSEIGGYKYGFFLRNVGDSASQVTLSPHVRLGDLVLSSGTLPLLLKQHNDVFLPVSLDRITGGGIIPNNLADLIAELPVNDNGVRLPPRVRITYQTPNGSWLGSTYQLHVGSNKAVSVSFLKRELLVYGHTAT